MTLNAIQIMAALRKEPQACPYCREETLDRLVDLTIAPWAVADVICDTCRCGWTEKYTGPQLTGVVLDDGQIAQAG